MLRGATIAGILIALLAPGAFAQGIEVKAIKGSMTEERERSVDRAALAAQEKAEATLKKMLSRYRGKAQEPTFLFKLGEIQQQTSAILFRLAHGTAHGKKQKLDLKAYRAGMQRTISTFSELIRRYPRFEEIHLAYFLRGKSHEEMEDRKAAARDYLHLVKNFPDVPETTPAYMSLAQFAIDENNHPQAIKYLMEVEKYPNDPQYPFALYKLAWSHYNLNNIATALEFATRHVRYYDERLDKLERPEDVAASPELALRDNTLQDITVFYLTGFEKEADRYAVSDALSFFRKLHKGPTLGRMMTRFAKLLRSHGHDQELIRWKDLVLKNEFERPEALEVVITTYEHLENRRRHKDLPESALDMVRLYKRHPKFEGFADARKMLLKTAEDMQKILVKNKGAQGLREMSVVLASIYDSFTKIVEKGDPRIPKVHYNLAETLFEIAEYERATSHYRWVVDNGKWDRKNMGSGSVADASLKAISSRYQVLKARKKIPGELAARKFPKSDPSKLEPLIKEWVAWIDEHIDRTGNQIDNFYFEATRTLYAEGHVHDALKRMKRFSERNATSKFAIPAASLTLDTYLKSERWQETNELAREFLKIREWKGSEFGKRLFVVAADTSFKMVELAYEEKDYEQVLERTDAFMKEYSKSARTADILALAGNSALSIQEPKKAGHYFSKLISEAPESKSVASALLARAKLAEEGYDFPAAAKDYKSYLDLPDKIVKIKESQAEKYREKILALSWLSGDQAALTAYMNTKGFCADDLAEACDRYQSLLALSAQAKAPSKDLTKKAFEKAHKGYGDNKAYWAAVALEGSKDLPFRDRNLMIRLLANNWDDVDPSLRLTLIPRVSVTVPRAFDQNREAMGAVAPLRASERYITRRIEVIRELENAATAVMKKLPWNRIRALTLNQIASVYIDLSQGLASLKPPKGLPAEELSAYEGMIRKLVIPFEEKAQEMRSKAYEIASTHGIERDSFHAVADPFFRDNPSLASRIKPSKEPAKPMALDLKALDELDPSADWDDLDENSRDVAVLIKSKWARALREKNWAQVSFFVAEASEKKAAPKLSQNLMRAMALAAAGAQAEGLSTIAEQAGDLEGRAKSKAYRLLIGHYLATYSREKTAELWKKMESHDPAGASSIASTLQWGNEPTRSLASPNS